MKKIILVAMALIMTVAMTSAVSAAVFTDFDSWTNFTAGGNPVYNAEDAADYWIGNWDSGGQNGLEAAAIVDGKGVGGSKALEIYEDATDNVGLYLFGEKSGIPSDYTGAKYLRVWMDLTDMGFRKANWGVIDSTYSLFTTDEVDEVGCLFYYLADGSSEWVEMEHGGDGCFGDAQNSDVYGFKGYFAFPVADFWIRSNANWDALDAGTPANMSDVKGVYLFWDYSDYLIGGDKFYIDNIEFVEDYKVFDTAAAAEETAAPAEETAAPAAEETAAAAPVETVTSAPATGDIAFIASLGAVLSACVAKIIKKRK